MDVPKKSVMTKEEQQLSPAANPAAAVMTAEADAINEEQDKAAAATSADHTPPPPPPAAAAVAAGRVTGEMDMASGSGDAHPAPRSPLATAVSALADHVLECMVKVLMRKCHPPQEVYPLIGKSPLRPPWWPTGRELWWPELGAGAVVPPYRPARFLSKAEKEVAVVAMVKNLVPDFKRLAMAVRMAPSVTSRITDAEARAWDDGVATEREEYMARHPHRATPTRARSLMDSLKPEAVRMKLKAPKPKPQVTIKVEDAAPFLTVSAAADPAAVKAAMGAIEAMRNSSKDPDAPYYPMPSPLRGHNEVGPNDYPAENPTIWKEFNRKEGQLKLLRVGKKNGWMVISDRVDGGANGSGPRKGHLVMKTYKKAQEYYHELRNKGAMASGAGVKIKDDSETESDNEDEMAYEKAMAKANARAMYQQNKVVIAFLWSIIVADDQYQNHLKCDDAMLIQVLKLKIRVKPKVMMKMKRLRLWLRLRLRLELYLDQTKCFSIFLRSVIVANDRYRNHLKLMMPWCFVHYRDGKGWVKLRQSKSTGPTLDPARYRLARAMPDSLSGHE
uniref:Ethylene insensitive 3-like DNA-binding domain-containing protein n=1 Tax=Oryza meridionalis TaxID=40149 RepID=A0A0E0EA21_9ORYZ